MRKVKLLEGLREKDTCVYVVDTWAVKEMEKSTTLDESGM